MVSRSNSEVLNAIMLSQGQFVEQTVPAEIR